jgi:hypothetical protein
MTDLSDNQRWKEHLKRHENTTDKPACPYYANQGIQFNTSKLQAHIRTEHSRRENTLTTFKLVNRVHCKAVSNTSRSQNHSLPCIFHLILGCNVSFPKWKDKAWRSHNISHFGPAGPPNHTICMFCDEFRTDGDPQTCWEEFFVHTYDHLIGGRKIDNSRPTFRVLKYMYENGCILKEDYDHCIA